MMRRCTQSRCRRQFRITGDGPVRCPYCGHTYPRLQPDSRTRGEAWGFCLRVDPGELSPGGQRRALIRSVPGTTPRQLLCVMPRTVFYLDGDFSLMEAEAVAGRLRRRGMTAQPVSARVMPQGGAPILRLRRQ